MGWNILLAPFTSIIDKLGDYQIKKQENKENKSRRTHELEEAKHTAKVDRLKRNDNTEMDYDRIAQENAKVSIVDELMITWVLTIVTLLFIPATSEDALAGFKALEQVPTWFQLIVVGGFISKLGLRFLFSGRTLFGKIVK
jgi:hypothetical protein